MQRLILFVFFAVFPFMVSALEKRSLKNKVWYVDNSAADFGDGGSQAPFNTLMAAQNASDLGDVIYVFQGDGTTRGLDMGFVMKPYQKLLGSGRHHTLLNEEGTTTILNSGFGFPRITNSIVGSPAITLASGCEVAGLHLTRVEGSAAILGVDHRGISPSFYGVDDVSIHHNIIDNCHVTKGAISLFNCSGALCITHNLIENITSATECSGIAISNALIPIDSALYIAHNALSNTGEHGLTIFHHSPGGRTTSVVEHNQLSNFSRGSPILFGTKKRIAIGACFGIFRNNTMRKSHFYGLEIISCGSSNVRVEVNNNRFKENMLGNLLAHSHNKSTLRLKLNHNEGDRSYCLQREDVQSYLVLESPDGNTGEVILAGQVLTVPKGAL